MTRLGQKNMLDQVLTAAEEGKACLIENVGKYCQKFSQLFNRDLNFQ